MLAGAMPRLARLPRLHNSQLVVPPPDSRPGSWAGAPSAMVHDGKVWLAYRLRRPVGEGRGYANVVAVSDAPQFEDTEFDTLLNLTVIVEVLSPSTEADDRGDKFARYRRIPSLCEYVLVNQDCLLVERFTRRGDEWVLSEFDSLDQILRLESLGCDVPLREVYAKTTVAAGSGQEAV